MLAATCSSSRLSLSHWPTGNFHYSLFRFFQKFCQRLCCELDVPRARLLSCTHAPHPIEFFRQLRQIDLHGRCASGCTLQHEQQASPGVPNTPNSRFATNSQQRVWVSKQLQSINADHDANLKKVSRPAILCSTHPIPAAM